MSPGGFIMLVGSDLSSTMKPYSSSFAALSMGMRRHICSSCSMSL